MRLIWADPRFGACDMHCYFCQYLAGPHGSIPNAFANAVTSGQDATANRVLEYITRLE
jgi:hypothetical protein